MKKILILIIFFFFFCSFAHGATTYLDVDATESGCAGTSADPCKELDHIEDDTYSNGDKILLECGDTWSKSAGDWGAVGDDINILETYITIGAYYLDGATPREVDGSTYKCSDVGEINPTIDGNVSSGWSGSVFDDIFRIEGGSNNITIQDIKFTNYYNGVKIKQIAANEDAAISDITIQRCEFDNFGRKWVFVTEEKTSNDIISDITIQNCTATKGMKIFAGGAGGWGNCISMHYADNAIIRYNNFGQCNGEGINLKFGADGAEVYENIVWDIDGGAVKAASAINGVYRHNYIIHTNDSTYDNRSNAGLVISSEGDIAGSPDPSNNKMYGNVVAGFQECFWSNDGEDDADEAPSANLVYNNTFIDCENNYRLPTGGDNMEFEIDFQNNLSVINNDSVSDHVAYSSVHANANWLGNGWDESSIRDTDFCSSSNCNDGADVTGDPDLVNPTPCTSDWRGCLSWSTPDWGDAALDSASDFIDQGADIGAGASYLLLASTSEWVDSVVTANPDTYGWPFGAYTDATGVEPPGSTSNEGVQYEGIQLN